ncbi:putative ferric reductase [Roseovarius sp. MBR-79]|jgi:predicted ferric reductase
MTARRAILIWGGLAVAVGAPLVVAATSPLLAWREPVYIAAGFAGVVAMALMLLQPLLAGGYLPGLGPGRGRRVHRLTGVALLVAVIGHVVGLWITSPPDAIDALLLRSPAPFAPWGVIAMWGVFAAALLALVRTRLRPRVWRLGHGGIVALVVVTSAAHALLIEGTMGTVTKAVLCALTVVATAKVLSDLRIWRLLRRRGA